MTNKQQALSRYLQPSAHAWIVQEARQLSEAKILDEGSLHSVIRARFALSRSSRFSPAPFNGADLDAVTFLVVMQATSDMDRALSELMAEIKTLTASKAKLRSLLAAVSSDAAANSGKDPSFPCTSHLCEQYPRLSSSVAVAMQQVPRSGPLYKGAISTVGELLLTQKRLTASLDSLNDLSDAQSLRLQMMMDERSKLIETLSNVVKKISGTSDTLVQNLK